MAFPLLDLPNELIHKISLSLTLRGVFSLSRTNLFLKDLINHNYFWYLKFTQDYGKTEYKDNLKDLYLKYGPVYGIGDNLWNQLGVDCHLYIVQSPERVISPKIIATQISAGNHYTIVIDLNDDLWACGLNNYGQLGLGDFEYRSKLTMLNLKAKYVSAGYQHTIMIDLEDNVWTWGSNSFGQLGIKKIRSTCQPIQITDLKAKQVSAGYNYSVFINMKNNVFIIILESISKLLELTAKQRIASRN
jgi:alpha-tubulin suppressor-like RCC1 family protein